MARGDNREGRARRQMSILCRNRQQYLFENFWNAPLSKINIQKCKCDVLVIQPDLDDGGRLRRICIFIYKDEGFFFFTSFPEKIKTNYLIVSKAGCGADGYQFSVFFIPSSTL